MDRQPISKEGYDKLREELRLLDDELPLVTQRIADARAEGDLRENAEYHGQREEQGRLMARIQQLKSKIADCYIVDRADMPKGVVTFGSVVTVKDLGSDSEDTYEFVGPGEEDYSGDIMKILTSSPIASGLMGKKVGDAVEIKIPRGTMKLQVVKIADQ